MRLDEKSTMAFDFLFLHSSFKSYREKIIWLFQVVNLTTEVNSLSKVLISTWSRHGQHGRFSAKL